MTNDQQENPVDRRLFLRGGAVLAGAAGVSVLGAALGPSKAAAADGPPLVVGVNNASTTTTGLTIDGVGGGPDPALALTNASGPSLRLTPAGNGYDGGLALGEIANTEVGPEIGVLDDEDNLQTTWLATGLDLDQLPVPVAVTPERLVDTRYASGRELIRTTSPGAFDSKHRLKAGAWMDVALIPTTFFGLDAAFVNVTAVTPVTGGYLVGYPPGDRPVASLLNFDAGRNVANGAFIQVGVAQEDPDWFVIRIYSSAVSHIVVDLNGVTLRGTSGSPAAKRGNLRQRNAVKANRMRRVFR